MSFPGAVTEMFPSLHEPRTPGVVTCRRHLEVQGEISAYARGANVVIAIAFKNARQSLRQALRSALAQRLSEGHCAVLLLDDQSDDAWLGAVNDWLGDPAVIRVLGNCGSAAHARNAALDFVERELPAARWVARLDADDVFDSTVSVEALRAAGEANTSEFVVGSNALVDRFASELPNNIAEPDCLLNPVKLMSFIEAFCSGRSEQELPSCNLLIRTGLGIRYPSMKSAEDHWLVAGLLLHRRDRASVVSRPLYCRYRLDGPVTTENRGEGEFHRSRKRLAEACGVWAEIIRQGKEVLGYGLEGCVWHEVGWVYKRFYPWAGDVRHMDWLAGMAPKTRSRIPSFEWQMDERNRVLCRYQQVTSQPVLEKLPVQEIEDYLVDLARARVVTLNIKRDNLRLCDGRLTCIDIGRDIVPYSPSRFLDASARLYAIGVLGFEDGELARRATTIKAYEAYAELPGFDGFFRRIIERLHPLVELQPMPEMQCKCQDDVTLLIKTCPQDQADVHEQVVHIVSQLTGPTVFGRVVVLVDSFAGPYLRQHAAGDLAKLMKSLEMLCQAGVVDEIWVAPSNVECVASTYGRWFAREDVTATHTGSGAPLYSQLWAFDQVQTRYVLQADVDVLIGRKDASHDYLSEMLSALRASKVWCVGFNIPKADQGFQTYTAPLNGFVPEIRLGLLDLARIRASWPLPNEVDDGHLRLMWHRSMELAQSSNGMRSLRGGDDRSFYVHPPNSVKADDRLDMIRDLVSQGRYPAAQAEQWDLVVDAEWVFETRGEEMVFVMMGRNTPIGKLHRSLRSLKAQTDQDFGIIFIDDGSEPEHRWRLTKLFAEWSHRTTLVRRRQHAGYLPNFILASNLCVRADALICILDQDDSLMNPDVVGALKAARSEGADLINGMMFRPDKPLRQYFVDYDAPRAKGGGNTWVHLRAFTKSLFDRVPVEHFRTSGEWVQDATDYATMLPMAELAENPRQLVDAYHYWHERGPYDTNKKAAQARFLMKLMQRDPLFREHQPGVATSNMDC